MPTYVYRFLDCDGTIEVQQSFSDDALTEAVHPSDGQLHPVKKVFTPVGVTFKGNGFYKTDSRGSSSSTAAAAKGDGAAGSGSGSGDSGSSSTPSTPSSTPASTPAGSSGSSGGSSGSSGSSGGSSSGGSSSGDADSLPCLKTLARTRSAC